MFWNRNKPQLIIRSPRVHHYVFAHLMLREACTQDPFKFFDIMGSPEREEFLAYLWQLSEMRVGKPLADLDPKDISVKICMVKDLAAIVVKMPPPVATSEAHFVGLVLTNLMGDVEYSSELKFRYFTLEQGSSLDGSTRTVLCEWVDGAHVNKGDGPAPTVNAFKEAMAGAM